MKNHDKTIKTLPVKKLPDLNGKFNCRYFTHIDHAPTRPIPESELPMQLLIEDSDNPANAVKAKLITLARCSLGTLSSIDTYLASGMERAAFLNKFYSNNPAANHNTPIAIYVYEKVISS